MCHGTLPIEQIPAGKRVIVAAEGAEAGDLEISVQCEDLVAPYRSAGEDFRVIEGAPRSRREALALAGGDEAAARRSWAEAAPCASAAPAPTGNNFASCLRGHFLHARCFQRALFEGNGCPACGEALWVPPVARRRGVGEGDGDECCAGTRDSDAEVALNAAADVEDAAAAESGGAPASVVGRGMRMCPSCYAGPIENSHCNDLAAHHGQCPTCRSKIPNPDATIASALATLGPGRTVGEVLPACPNPGCRGKKVMFNGCLACGQVFTRERWNQLPAWDPQAQTAQDLDARARKAARLLAVQVRGEAAHLAHERQALQEAEAEVAGAPILAPFCRPVRPPPVPRAGSPL